MVVVPIAPEEGVNVSNAVVAVKLADLMKLVPVDCDTSTLALPEVGTAILTPDGMLPVPSEVNVVVVPPGQATVPLVWKQ